MNKKIPKGWVKTKLNYTAELIGGGTPSRRNFEYFNGNIIWLTPTEIPKDGIAKISDSREKITELGLQKSSAKLIPQDAVLLTSRASIGYVAIAGTQVTTNQGFASFICNDSMFNYYLAYWLWSNKSFLEENATGTTFKEISKSKLKELEIPLPPLNEQKRIVSKIESIFSQIDACRKNLEGLASHNLSVPGSMAQLRSGVLKQAFEGKLVPQDPNDEPAEMLLKKLCINSKIDPIFEKDGLPEGWLSVALGLIIEPSNEKFNPKTKENRIYIGLEHIESNTNQIIGHGDSNDTKSTKIVFRKGDVLYGKLRPYLNKVCIPNFDGVCSTDILVFPKNSNLHNKHLSWFLATEEFVRYATEQSTGVTLPRVNFKTVAKYSFPLPPLREQCRIVAKIESIFAQIDAMDNHIRTSLERLNTLKSIVLKQAFEGKLVPQDPNDEPASVLLQTVKFPMQKSSRGRKNVQ